VVSYCSKLEVNTAGARQLYELGGGSVVLLKRVAESNQALA